MKLSDLRSRVRTQTETLEDELPNTTIDWYLRQAFDRTMAMENQWPWLQKSWALTVPAGDTEVALPGDVNKPGILSLTSPRGLRLQMIDHDKADEWFAGVDPASVQALYYSIWAGQVKLWPRISFAEDLTYTLRGHRLPTDWVGLGPEAEPDCDPRLHMPLIHYAIALAYAQQEDEVLENVYMTRWQSDLNQIIPAIMEPVHHKPLVMGGSIGTPIGVPGPGAPRMVVVPPGGP
jgi:hypothetical protein